MEEESEPMLKGLQSQGTSMQRLSGCLLIFIYFPEHGCLLVCMYMYHLHACGPQRPEEDTDPTEMKLLQMFVRCHVDAGNHTHPLQK